MTQSEKDVYEIIVDNYKGNKTNTYKVKRENLDDLVKNDVFFPNAYFYVLNEDLTSEPSIPLWGIKSAEKAKDKGIAQVWTKEEQDRKIGDEVMEEMLINLGALTEKRGDVSKLRFVVALDRLGLLDN
jgi:hypothetical protein